MNIVVDELMTTCTMAGDGPVMLFLHGWGDSLQTFDKLSEHFLDNYTVLCLDLPGFGGTQAPNEAYDLEAYARFVAHAIEKLGVDVDVSVGHSNGGAILIKGTSMGLLKTNRLVLLASAGVRSTYSGRKKALRIAAKAAKVPITFLPAGTQTRIKKRAYKAVGSDLFVAEHMQETFRNVVSEDLVASSANVSQPVLLIYGSKDIATPASYGESFVEAMPHAELTVVEGADHFLHQTHTDAVAERMQVFMKASA